MERKLGGLPRIAQSIDNAKIKTTTEPIEEVKSSTKQSVSRRETDLSLSEAGCFDDHKSLANINIIRIANGGISPTSTTNQKRLKSRYAYESL